MSDRVGGTHGAVGSGLSIAVIGVTGAVGEALLDILREKAANWPVARFFPVASQRSVGQSVLFRSKTYAVIPLEEVDFSLVDLAFFVSTPEVAREWIPQAMAGGALVIDNSTAYRLDPHIPLVIPEVNGEELIASLREDPTQRLIANPNCAVILLLMALHRIYRAVGIRHIVLSTYQSVSGAGQEGLSALAQESVSVLQGQAVEEPFFPEQIAFNVIPQIASLQEDGSTEEESKIFAEACKILQDPDLIVDTTCVRVPVFYGHSLSVYCETVSPISLADMQRLLKESPGLIYRDERLGERIPTALEMAALEGDFVAVGRLRANRGEVSGFQMWVVGDAVRKGAALNAIQIAEMLRKEGFL